MTSSPTPSSPPMAASPTAAIGNIVAGLSIGGHLAQLSGRAVQVLVAILARYNVKKAAAWPSVSDLADRTGLSVDTVSRALADLEKSGLIIVVRVAGRRSRYLLPAHVRDLAYANPWRKRSDDPPQSARTIAQPSAPLRIEQGEDLQELHENQQDEAPTIAQVEVVVDEIQGENPERAELEGQHTQVDEPERLSHDLYQQLRQLGVRAPWRLAQHGETRIRQALKLLGEARGVANPAGWLMSALQNGWAKPTTSARSEALTEATREHKANIERTRAELADPEQGRRSKLAMVAAMATVLRPDGEKLQTMLARHGLTLSEYLSYQRDLAADKADESNE